MWSQPVEGSRLSPSLQLPSLPTQLPQFLLGESNRTPFLPVLPRAPCRPVSPILGTAPASGDDGDITAVEVTRQGNGGPLPPFFKCCMAQRLKKQLCHHLKSQGLAHRSGDCYGLLPNGWDRDALLGQQRWSF